MLTSPRGIEMKANLPLLYAASVYLDELFETIGTEFDLLRTAIDELRDQLHARTATWALDQWEDFVGLPRGTGLTDSQRQDRIVAKLVGYGPANKLLIQTVTNTYVYGTSEIEDVNDNPGAALPDYTIKIRFIDPSGIPDGIETLQAVLREIVPAHLDIVYEYNYTVWNDIDAFNRTWDQWDTANAGGPYTWDEMEAIA